MCADQAFCLFVVVGGGGGGRRGILSTTS